MNKCVICKVDTKYITCNNCNLQAIVALIFKNTKYLDRFRQLGMYGSYLAYPTEKQD